MARPSLLAVILNWRTPDLALQAAETALPEIAALGGEIVIVDNDSGDGSFERMAAAAGARGWTRDNRVRVVPSGRNGGFGAGNNFGMALGLSSGARPDFFYILNSDAWPEPGAIGALLAAMAADPRAGMAGSYIHGPDGVPHQTAFRFPSIPGEFEAAVKTGIFSRLLRRWIVPLPIPAATVAVDWCAGASILMRRAMLDEIGGFDETFFLYYEETDLCRRAARAGWTRLYVPESRVVHIGSVSTGMKTWQRTPGYWFDSRRHYFVKNHGRAYWAAATAAQVAGTLIWRLRCALSNRPHGMSQQFLYDLVRHSMRAIFGQNARP